MAFDGSVFTPKSAEYLERMERQLGSMSPDAIAARVRQLVQEDEEWRGRQCINMNAAENTISRTARRLLDSDLATRVTEGFPGDKSFPLGRQNTYVDEIEAVIITLARRLFRAKYVEWRAVSTTMANSAIFHALTEPGDVLLVQSMEGGANIGYQREAIPSLRHLVIEEMPIANDEFEIDVAGVRQTAQRCRPKMLVIGGSCVLFPYPVQELRAIADEVGALFLYDAAHVAVLVATGFFQDPLAEGAHVMSTSTQKSLSGPVGGLVLTNDPTIAQRILKLTFPALMQTRDQNKYAATAHVLAEMTAFGGAYARQIVANARALAEALDAEGFKVLGKARGYTATHQVFLDAIDYGARKFEAICRDCNILFHANHMRGDTARGMRTGLRFSVMETTRRGMKELEMHQIAQLVRRAVVNQEPAARLAGQVEQLVGRFPNIEYSFDRHGQGG
jgi:glycine hydroxymethyltransferase